MTIAFGLVISHLETSPKDVIMVVLADRCSPDLTDGS